MTTDEKEDVTEIKDDELKAIVGGMVASVRSGNGSSKSTRTSRTGRTGNSGVTKGSRGGGPPQIPL